MSYLTFSHRFSARISCTVRIKDEPPSDQTPFAPRFEWTERPKRKHLPEYCRWILHVVQICADRWNVRILYVLGPTPNTTEWWTFEPGKAPVLQQKLNVGIPNYITRPTFMRIDPSNKSDEYQ